MKRNLITKILVLIIVVITLAACSKDIVTGADPYAGGKESLGIGFYINYPDPGTAKPGELVDFYVKGLKGKLDQINFFVNNTAVEIVSAKDSLITIKVPPQITSGDAKVVVGEEVFYGPRLEIEGNTSVDENYGMVNGFRGAVYDILPNAGGFIVAGSFSNFENESNYENVAADKRVYRNGVHFIDANGKSNNNMNFRQGTFGGGYIRSIAKTNDGKFIFAGSLGSFAMRSVGNIVRVNNDGKIDSMIVEVINTGNDPKNSLDTVSAFNGGVNSTIIRTFATSDNKVIAVGNFTSHFKIDYNYSSRDTRRYILSAAKGVIRMKEDGSLDSTFALNNAGANAQIFDAAMIDNERIVIVGAFTTYNGKVANGIACIKADGSLDETFSLKGNINRLFALNYNSSLKKLAVSGIFTGAGASGKVNNVALMNTDGTVDDTFILRDLGTGVPNYAQILNNGQVLIDGTQNSYAGIPRSNLLILEKNGELLQKYNSLGPFVGSVSKVVETKSSLGEPALLVGGSILQFGQKTYGNFFRLEIKN
ncbi:DUF5008 domain-containing protein [Sphingobacterium sp. UBA1498]|uniref:DUF5008 domain-containing protein n=1 Tax=Sphingobacterium sp. UBA1498 TaxID=1947481 RepID=UPI0025EE9801|nr:DUF5008 domain-containing protein [Sphingobacterium sp. UBA1498]